MGVLEAMFLAPLGVCRRAALVETSVRVRKHEAHLDIRALILDQQVLVPVIDRPNAFTLDIKRAAVFRWQLEIWAVCRRALWPHEANFLGLI